MEKISEIHKDDIELESNIVKNKRIELDNKVNNYLNHPNKYNEIPFDISKIMEYVNDNKICFNEEEEEEEEYIETD